MAAKSEASEAELANKLEAHKRLRVESAVEQILPILDRYGVMLEAQVTIQGTHLRSQVVFRTKD